MSNSKYYKKDGVKLILGDSLEAMKSMPDNSFDIAIVDPPYGIDIAKAGKIGGNNAGKAKDYGSKEWDSAIPTSEYFSQLMRVSKNQIIWGGNYFPLPQTIGWCVWKKMDISNNFTPFELAWTSTSKGKMYDFLWAGMWQKDMKNKEKRIHPTQKPVALYKWLLETYTSEGDLILDTHLGSGSIAIACHRMKRQLVGYEIDEEYFNAACKRFDEQTRQQTLW